VILTLNFHRISTLFLVDAFFGTHNHPSTVAALFRRFSQSFHLNIQTGASGIDYDAVAKREHLDSMAIEIKKLNDRLATLRASQSYHKVRHLASSSRILQVHN
jgi:hypothetical protein